MDFDYDIIKEFIPIEDKSSFLVFESVRLHGNTILAPYRMLWGSNNMTISLSDYLSKKREKKINEILNH
jgi:hypothetical protein